MQLQITTDLNSNEIYISYFFWGNMLLLADQKNWDAELFIHPALDSEGRFALKLPLSVPLDSFQPSLVTEQNFAKSIKPLQTSLCQLFHTLVTKGYRQYIPTELDSIITLTKQDCQSLYKLLSDALLDIPDQAVGTVKQEAHELKLKKSIPLLISFPSPELNIFEFFSGKHKEHLYLLINFLKDNPPIKIKPLPHM